jgi:hypothetical protein
MFLVDAGQLFRCAGQPFMCIAWFAVFEDVAFFAE